MVSSRRQNPSLLALHASREKFLDFLRRRISDPEIAEDLLQQSFLQALKAGGDLQKKQNVVSWFYRVLQNALIDYYRRRASSQRKAVAFQQELSAAPLNPPQDEKKSICQCMHGLLPGMNSDYAQLLERIDLRGESPDQLAKTLKITRNNVTVRLHRARKALKQRLQSVCGSCSTHGCLDCTCKQPS